MFHIVFGASIVSLGKFDRKNITACITSTLTNTKDTIVNIVLLGAVSVPYTMNLLMLHGFSKQKPQHIFKQSLSLLTVFCLLTPMNFSCHKANTCSKDVHALNMATCGNFLKFILNDIVRKLVDAS